MSEAAAHRELILDQFTRQAAPFSAAAMIADDAILQRIVDAAAPAPDDILLDVACGPGLVVCAFAPYVRHATGIDMTAAMLGEAAELAVRKGLCNVTWDQGDAYALPYADASFTVIVTRYSLHHLLDPLAAVREMARVCAPGGRVVVVDAYAPDDPVKAAAYHRVEMLRDPSHARSLTLGELHGLFGGAGLGEPRRTLYDLDTDLRALLARAFPDPGSEAEIVETFFAAADDDRLGIPVRRDENDIRIAYQAAILVAAREF